MKFMHILGFVVGILTVLDIQQKGMGYKMLPSKTQKCLTKIFAK
ncbi:MULTISPECIES: hypothetical protein [Kurthia]|uniref:Uncharacterized protein n=1 Tax=Kurthia populi TaxID=1562132 RepID=A0ABW5Y2M4_9BACL|nr:MULTISPECIES: hypothetical protein [unclassified Kurthia]